jgi:DNA polymerase elongation subunit (family B)
MNFPSNLIDKLLSTKDEDLLYVFPGYRRSVLRSIKRSHNTDSPPPTLPKILIFDIETSPIEAYVWGLYDQNIGINQIINDWFIITWSAKWLFSPTVISHRLSKKEAIKKDDKRIVKELWKLIDEADIVVAHNGDAFDIKKMKARFLKFGLTYPSPYKSVDTLKIARREFKITSNKLDYLCKYVGLPAKIDTGGFDLWKDCLNGNEEALLKMDTYCQNDVRILEDIYIKLRPYMHNHPNVGLYMETEDDVCPSCGSNNLKWGYVYSTISNQYQSAKCECGTYIRKPKSINSIKIKAV